MTKAINTIATTVWNTACAITSPPLLPNIPLLLIIPSLLLGFFVVLEQEEIEKA